MERKRKHEQIYKSNNNKNKKKCVDIIELMNEYSKENINESMLCYKNKQLLNRIIVQSQYDTIKYMLEYYYKHNCYDDIMIYIFDYVCSYNYINNLQYNVNMIKYLIGLDIQMGNVITIHYYSGLIFINMCRQGNLEIVKCILDTVNKSEQYIDIYEYERGYINACAYNHIDIVVYLIEYAEQYKYNIDIQQCINILSNDYTMTIKKEIIQYIIEYSEKINNRINIYIDKSYFYSHKITTKFDTIKYLMYLYKHNYNIDKDYNTYEYCIFTGNRCKDIFIGKRLYRYNKKYNKLYSNKYIYNNQLVHKDTYICMNDMNYIFYVT